MADLNILAKQISNGVDDYLDASDLQAREKLLKAIEKMHRTVLGPAEYITRIRYQPLQNMSLAMALEMRLVQAIFAKKGESTTADELAATTKSDRLLTVRIMRMLTALDMCKETGTQTYASNANADYLNSPTGQGGIKFLSVTTLKNMANVIPYMRSNAGVFHQIPDREVGEIGSFKAAYGVPLWDHFRQEPEVMKNFMDYLSGRRENIAPPWYEIFPAAEKIEKLLSGKSGDRPLVVDIGGNLGYDLQNFKRSASQLKGKYVLQDLGEVITKARPLVEKDGIECVVYDFFTPPPVKGACIYYFGGICHDWDDAKVVKILGNTAAAMDEDSIIVIDEYPSPDRDAPLSSVTYDILMMLNVNGIERTIGHWQEIFRELGLELVECHRSSLDWALEVRLKR